MKESEYINATNLVKLRTAIMLLGDTLYLDAKAEARKRSILLSMAVLSEMTEVEIDEEK